MERREIVQAVAAMLREMRGESAQRVKESMTRTACHVTGCASGVFLDYDPPNASLRVAFAHGIDGVGREMRSGGVTAAGRAAEDAAVFATDGKLTEIHPAAVAELAGPVVVDGEVWGVVQLFTTGPMELTDLRDDLSMFCELVTEAVKSLECCGPEADEEDEVFQSLGKRILIVDDEHYIREILSTYFRACDCEVAIGTDGSEGLELAMGGEYDLVVSDIRMPRMTGLEFYDRLLEAKPQFNGHFVFMSGDLMSRDCRQKVMKTARPFLEKPFLPQELLRLVPLAS